MRILFTLLILLVPVVAVAQDRKNELSVTAIYVRQDPDFRNFESFVNRTDQDQAGVTVQYARQLGSSVANINIEYGASQGGDTRFNTLTGGLLLQSAHNKVSPFGRLNAGLSRITDRNNAFQIRQSDLGFAFIAGGGLKFRLTKNFALVLPEINYVLVRADGLNIPHLRAGAGLAVRF